MEATRRRPVWAVCATVVVAAAVLSLLWTDTASTQIAPSGWRCYPAKQPKGAPKFVPVSMIFNGTLQGTTGQAIKPVLFCDPINGGGTNSTSNDMALVCYSIKDESGTPKFPETQVQVTNFGFAFPFNGTLATKKSKIFCELAFGSLLP